MPYSLKSVEKFILKIIPFFSFKMNSKLKFKIQTKFLNKKFEFEAI